MIEKFTEFLTSIELVIRHLLSGAAVYAIYLLALTEPTKKLDWIESHFTLATFITVSLGFGVYSLYRAAFWVFGDGTAWLLRLSGPALSPQRKKGLCYHGPYAEFLRWRLDTSGDYLDEHLTAPLSDYLRYRWAVVHFVLIVGFSLLQAFVTRERKSVIDDWSTYTLFLMVGCFVLGLWQASLLFRVERELYRKSPTKPA